MKFEQFREEMKKAVEAFLGEEIDVKKCDVTKNNGVKLHGIAIGKKGDNIYSNIYLEPFFELHEEGEPLSLIIYKVIVAYQNGKPQKKLNMEFFSSYERVKPNIVFKLVNYEKNKELLKEIPHIPFLDLAIVFYCMLKNNFFENGSILIYNQHKEMWKISDEQLYCVAKKNAARLLPGEIKTMEEIMRETLADNMEELLETICMETKMLPMYIMTNQMRLNGAACILYRDMLKNFSDRIQKDIYILPSSIHEVILIPAEKEKESEKFSDMVREVNGTELEAEEILSDHVYYYCRETENIVLCDK